MQAETTSGTTALTRRTWLAIVWGMGLQSGLIALFQHPRRCSADFFTELQAGVVGGGFAGGMRRLLVYLTLLLTICTLSAALRHARLRRAGGWLFLGMLTFSATVTLGALWGTRPSIHVALVIVPGALAAIYLLEPVPLPWLVRHIKIVLLVYGYGSLVAVAVAPTWALQPEYAEGLIPGMTYRLCGLATHPNVLSPLLITYLLLDLYTPGRLRAAWLHRVAMLACLLLTQSKTAWITLALLVMAHYVWLAWRERTLGRYLGVSVLTLLLAAAMAYLVIARDIVGAIAGDASLTTLTGRTEVWRATLEVWDDNRWFGYGPELLSVDMYPAYLNLPYEARAELTHAHNQFFQTLGEAGSVGVVGLMIYVGCLLAYGLRQLGRTHGVSLLLVLALLIRSVSEPSLRFSVGEGVFFPHLVVFAVLMLAARSTAATPTQTSPTAAAATRSLRSGHRRSSALRPEPHV